MFIRDFLAIKMDLSNILNDDYITQEIFTSLVCILLIFGPNEKAKNKNGISSFY